MEIKILHNAEVVADAIARKPEQVLPAVDRALFRGAIEVADEVKRQAPKATSTLTNSTQVKAKPLEYTVLVAARYAGYVHEGTTEGGRPTLAAMVEWIRDKLSLTSLTFQKLDDLVSAVGLPKKKLCTHCWDGSSYGI